MDGDMDGDMDGLDEYQMIATMLDEPPEPEAAAAGRRRLTEGIRGPRRRPLRSRWPVLGLAGVAAAAVVGAVLVSSGTSPRAPDPVDARPVSAREVLLSAAERAESSPDIGRYWHRRTLATTSVEVGPEGGRYQVEQRRVSETWARPDGQVWIADRDAGARPRTAADQAAWERDGRPTGWKGRSRLGGGRLTLAPGPGTVIKARGPRSFTVCDKEMSFTQVRALPTDPAGLRDAIRNAMLHNDDGPVPADAQTGFVRECLTGLLSDVPAPPKVRAAAYRALAGMPGVKATGAADDGTGRAGVGILIQDRGGAGTRLTIDPKTSFVLAETREPGGAPLPVKGHTLIHLQVGWTDEGPRIPALP
ncbi:CU044_5270 family protein [Actinomadura sp. NEAU-AAG7]|uniref:CU044_5270 family protein n=1 Tax=Actinomadura sp. NEAU-AAG7 TaxID=2839640 RepID=UPI001BE4698B|nr:CU044_5270 family protein [Actinomadura sp. NEAU-AAG7]MBT2206710.1 CU044_5270 family protein [Actinomadura sp. NEAU-AAG7]